MHVEHSVTIARPIAEVFAFVTDLRNETRWQPEIEAVRVEGPLRAGAIFHETRVSLGRRFDWEFRVTRFEPPHLISIETVAGSFPYRGSRRFEAVEGGTRVIESGELILPRPLRVFDGVGARLSRRPLREAYARLRALLEPREPLRP